MKNISNLFSRTLEEYKIYYQETLFPPQWDNLKQQRCPLCCNKLKYSENRKIYTCSSKKHGKSFIIREKQYNDLRSN